MPIFTAVNAVGGKQGKHLLSNVKKIRFFIFGKSYGKKNVLLCKQTGLFIRYFPLIRGNGVLFLSLKEKV
ncbi:MAG: hypothetical protein IKM00_07735, partial [Clostridia bacterium]|nr:hypothetical protein [Clostridia bacterium]